MKKNTQSIQFSGLFCEFMYDPPGPSVLTGVLCILPTNGDVSSNN